VMPYLRRMPPESHLQLLRLQISSVKTVQMQDAVWRMRSEQKKYTEVAQAFSEYSLPTLKAYRSLAKGCKKTDAERLDKIALSASYFLWSRIRARSVNL